MALPTREQLLALDYPRKGLPLAPVVAKSAVSPDTTYAGLPFTVFGAAGGGPPADPPAHPPTHMSLVRSDTPHTATTIGRETGDVLLMDDGFTLIEETGSLGSNLATIELFQSTTPTAGTWVLGRHYLTNAPTDGVLRSPLPTSSGADESASLTLVTTSPNTKVSFEWGVRGLFFPPADTDALHFSVNAVELLLAYPSGITGLNKGVFWVDLPAGTHALLWRWTRPLDISSEAATSHAWITALIIDPNF